MSDDTNITDRRERYTEYIAFAAEGLRAGLLSCKRCGAALLIGVGDDPTVRHDEWHEKMDSHESP
jgi:hypothetical protein